MSKQNAAKTRSPQRVTIRTIADELGVSFSTVSKALNDNPLIREETKKLVQTAIGNLQKLKMRTLAKFGKSMSGITKEEIEALGEERALPVLFNIARHIPGGNAPYTPDTPEYKALKGTVLRAEKLVNTFKKGALDQFIPEGQNLWDAAEPLVYNNRTGDDDNITIELWTGKCSLALSIER